MPNVGDNPLAGAPNLTWTRDVTTGSVAQSPTPRTCALGVLTEAPILNFGADIAPAAQVGPNPSFGVAGLFPDVCGVGGGCRPSRGGVGDGLSARVRFHQGVGSSPVLLLTGILSPLGQPIYLGNSSIFGGLSIDLSVTIPVALNSISSVGQSITTVVPGGPALCGLAGSGTFAAQAVVPVGSLAYYSNASKVYL